MFGMLVDKAVPPVSAPVVNAHELALQTSPSMPVDSFTNACHQYLEDHEHRPQGPGCIVFGMSQFLGQTLTRRLSNLVSCVGLRQFFPAQRDYPVLGACDELAMRFAPKLFTIDSKQSQDPALKPSQLRYEILPHQEDKDYLSIVYFVGLPTEKMPIPVLGKLYDWVRPVLFGSKQDWEAIQIDVDRKTGEPIGISYETSNYSNSPESYDLVSRKELHLFAKVSKMPNGTWVHTVQQKNGKIQTCEVPNPFREGPRPSLAIVSWNTSLDICDRVAKNSELKLYALEELKPQFMDMDMYRAEGMDLRATWLMQRRLGKFIFRLPPRSGLVAPPLVAARPSLPVGVEAQPNPAG